MIAELLLSTSIALAGIGPDGMVHEDDTVTICQEIAQAETETEAETEWHWDRSYGSDDWYIAHLMMAEAGNTDKQELQWTGSVPLNRVDSSSFPNTIAEVVSQPGQYATYSDGRFYMMVNGAWTSSDYWEPTEEVWLYAEELLDKWYRTGETYLDECYVWQSRSVQGIGGFWSPWGQYFGYT